MNKAATDEGEDRKHFESEWKDVFVPTVGPQGNFIFKQIRYQCG